MVKSTDVLQMLCQDVEYVCMGQNYEDINWLGNKPAITKKQFTDGFAAYEVWKSEQDAMKAATKSALLEKLGITAEEAALLLG